MSAASPPTHPQDRAARISLVVGVAVFAMKLGAWRLTSSVALLSDALESVVNVVAAAVMLAAVRVARRPPDADHPYGHGKVEYLSAAFEGGLIAAVAVVTLVAAGGRALAPVPLSNVGEGLAASAVATAANGALGMYLLRVGRAQKSLALEADGHHVLADVYTSVGVALGVTLARLTGWWRLDPLVAMAVAANILWVGWRLVRRAVGALVDELADPKEASALEVALDVAARELGASGVRALRLRKVGPISHADAQLLVPQAMSVGEAHALCDAVEDRATQIDARLELVLHVEPEVSEGGERRRGEGPRPA